jgi:hypothetical protein
MRAEGRTSRVTDDRHHDASDAHAVMVGQCDAEQREVARHCASEHVPQREIPDRVGGAAGGCQEHRGAVSHPDELSSFS